MYIRNIDVYRQQFGRGYRSDPKAGQGDLNKRDKPLQREGDQAVTIVEKRIPVKKVEKDPKPGYQATLAGQRVASVRLFQIKETNIF